MSVMPTRRRVTMLLRNDRRRTTNLTSLRRRTEAESFTSEVVGHSGVEWRTLGSVFGAGSPPTRTTAEQQIDASRRAASSYQVNSSYRADSSYRRTSVSGREAAPVATKVEVLNRIESSSLDRRDGD